MRLSNDELRGEIKVLLSFFQIFIKYFFIYFNKYFIKYKNFIILLNCLIIILFNRRNDPYSTKCATTSKLQSNPFPLAGLLSTWM